MEKVKTSEDKIKEILEGVVSAKMAEQQDSVQKNIEDAISKAISAETEKAKRIEVEDNFEKDAKGGFKSMGHYFRDVVRFDKTSGRNCTKEMDKWETHVKAAGTGLSEGDAQYAGHLLPIEFRNQLMVLAEESNDILPRCTTIPMSSNIIEVPIAWGFDKSAGLTLGGMKAYWIDELGVYTESRPRVEKIQMKLKKIGLLSYLSDELIEDSPQSVEALIKMGFQMSYNFLITNSIIRGTAGQMNGFLNSPALITISKEVGQSAATILFENLVKMVARFYGKNGVFICNKNCLPQLAQLSMTVGTGGVPVWMPAGGISGQSFSTLFGMPVIFNEHMSTLGTVGDIALCDFSQYWVGRKAGSQEMKYAESMHVMFLYDQQTLKFTSRIDGVVSWPTYITPANGDTMSPFVVLETRS